VDSDKVGRAIVRFGNSALAKEIFQDVLDGIRKLVSVGYDRTGIVESKKDKSTNAVTTRYRWQPTHIAIVPVPADTTVGVGREQVDSAPSTDKKTETLIVMPDTTPALDEAKLRSDAVANDRKRIKEITTAADLLIKDHGKRNGGKMADTIRGIVTECLANDTSVGDFQIRAMKEVLDAKEAKPVTLADCTENPGAYNLMRGIQSAVKRKMEGKSPVPEGLEGEVHQEMMRKANANGGFAHADMEAGFQVPPDAPLRGVRSWRNQRLARDMQATVFPSGGAFVPTQLVTPIIEVLRNMSVLDRLGIRRMAGLQGNIVIPRQEATATAYVVTEIQALTASQQILGQIALNPHRVGATQTYSHQFIMQSAPDAEAFMRDDMLKVIALQWDRLGLNGVGAQGEPLGIMNTPGIASVVFGATPTYIKLISMRTAIRKANVLDEIAYVSTPATEGSLAGVAEALTGATTVGGAQNAVWKPSEGEAVGEGRVCGCLAIASNQVPNDQVLAGAFIHLIHAVWGGITIVVDQYTKAGQAEVVLTMNTWGDYALRHPQAFCLSADSGAQ